MKTIKKTFMILGILIKVLIDTVIGLTIVLIVTILGFILTFIYKQFEIMILELKIVLKC